MLHAGLDLSRRRLVPLGLDHDNGASYSTGAGKPHDLLRSGCPGGRTESANRIVCHRTLLR